jgi:hypothetical protein
MLIQLFTGLYTVGMILHSQNKSRSMFFSPKISNNGMLIQLFTGLYTVRMILHSQNKSRSMFFYPQNKQQWNAPEPQNPQHCKVLSRSQCQKCTLKRALWHRSTGAWFP